MTVRDIVLSAAGSSANTTAVGSAYSGSSLSNVYKGTFGAGLFVAGTDNLGIAVSGNGVNWSLAFTSGTVYAAIYDVAWNGSLFVAVGGISSSFFTSPNGLNWTARSIGSSNIFYGVAWNGSLFVAVSLTGAILTSPDGITWTSRTSGTTQVLRSVKWANGLWVVVGYGGVILTSPDGVTWTSRSSGTVQSFLCVSWNGTFWLAIGANGAASTSSNGTTWSAFTPVGLTSLGLNDLLWSGTEWVGCVSNNTFTSSDGVTWTTRSTAGRNGQGLQSNGSRVTVTGSVMGYSDNGGTTWTFKTDRFTSTAYSIVYVNGAYYVGSNGIYKSNNGYQWSQVLSLPSSAVQDIAWNGTQFLAVIGSSDSVYTSPDGATWTSRNVGATQNWTVCASSPTAYVIASISPITIRSSPDGITWTARTVAGSYSGSFNAILYGGGLFVAVGTSGAIHTSPDGATWTVRTSGTTAPLEQVAYNGSLWVVTGKPSSSGQPGTILTSPDGITWTARSTALGTDDLAGVVWINNRWYISGDSRLQTSTNGTTWSVGPSLQYKVTNDGKLTTMAAGSNQFLGAIGNILAMSSPPPAITN